VEKVTEETLKETIKKWVFKSKTIWGVIGTTVFGVLPAINLASGWHVSPTDLLPFSDAVTNGIDAAGIIASAASTIYGRLTAKTELTVLPTAPVEVSA
jgi:hypothetical protein